jgi:Tol biopolymer transport system component
MLGTTNKKGKWTYPAPPEFIGGDVPFFSPNGKRLYFISRKPVKKGGSRKENIWFVERTKTGWSEPRPIDPIVNSAPMHWQFSIDRNGTFYIGSGDGRILVSPIKNRKYQNPVDFRKLYHNDSVKGGSPFISPDGDYLIFSKNNDLHITFRKPDGTWTQAQDLGDDINSASYDLCPMVTPDGKYLIYLTTRMGDSGPHWVAIEDTINNLRKKALNPQ